MVSDKEIYQTATLMLEKHGDLAEIEARARADALLNDGDMEGEIVWLKVIEAIQILVNEKPPGPLN